MKFTKQQLRKLVKRGTWIQVHWDDQPDTVELVISTPHWGDPYETTIETFQPTEHSGWITHPQVVAVLGQVKVPKPVSICRK